MGFTKLFGGLVHSTIWREAMHVKIVWITMLAIVDREGFVDASIPGLAHLAGVSLDECQEALDKLSAPDLFSRTKEFDGRRIEPRDGGWLVLNYTKYRESDGSPLRFEGSKGYVYFIGEPRGRRVKIGFSKNPWSRLAALRIANPKLVIIATERGERSDELSRQKQFAASKEAGEWYLISPELRNYMRQLDTYRNSGSSDQPLEADAEVEAEAKEKLAPIGGAAKKKGRPTWLTPYAVLWRQYFDGKIPFEIAAQNLRPLHDEHGEAAVLTELAAYLEQTEARYLSLPKFASAFGGWGKPSNGVSRNGGTSRQARNEATLDQFEAEHG